MYCEVFFCGTDSVAAGLNKLFHAFDKPAKVLIHLRAGLLLFNIANWFIMTIWHEKETGKNCHRLICR